MKRTHGLEPVAALKSDFLSVSVYPDDQEALDEATCRTIENRIVCHVYTSPKGLGCLETRVTNGGNQIWRSEDNGRSWRLLRTVPARQPLENGAYLAVSAASFFADPDHGVLVMCTSDMRVTPGGAYAGSNIMDQYTNRVYYQISRDEGKTWTPRKQLIQTGAGFDADHWADQAWYGRSALSLFDAPFAPPLPRLADGSILIPYTAVVPQQKDGDCVLSAGCFRMRWKEDFSDMEWHAGGQIVGGGCEQAQAQLRDGRILCIMRSQGTIEPYYFSHRLRPYALSSDGGQTWSEPRPLAYADGTFFTSPRAYSRLIRSSKNGRLYWIANILPAPADIRTLEAGNPSDPRHPLQIAEVDEEKVAIKKETVMIVADKEAGDPDLVRFSNFVVYEDRETKDIVILMMKSYSELTERWLELPRPNYRYRIRSTEGAR